MNDLFKNAAFSVLRSGLIAGATYAVAKGWLPAGSVESIVTALVGLAAAVWGAVDSRNKVSS